jgi:hypothetical protein
MVVSSMFDGTEQMPDDRTARSGSQFARPLEANAVLFNPGRITTHPAPNDPPVSNQENNALLRLPAESAKHIF